MISSMVRANIGEQNMTECFDAFAKRKVTYAPFMFEKAIVGSDL